MTKAFNYDFLILHSDQIFMLHALAVLKMCMSFHWHKAPINGIEQNSSFTWLLCLQSKICLVRQYNEVE